MAQTDSEALSVEGGAELSLAASIEQVTVTSIRNFNLVGAEAKATGGPARAGK